MMRRKSAGLMQVKKNRYVEFSESMMAKYFGFEQGYDPVSLLFPEEEKEEDKEEQSPPVTNIYQLEYLKEENFLCQKNITFLTNLILKTYRNNMAPALERENARPKEAPGLPPSDVSKAKAASHSKNQFMVQKAVNYFERYIEQINLAKHYPISYGNLIRQAPEVYFGPHVKNLRQIQNITQRVSGKKESPGIEHLKNSEHHPQTAVMGKVHVRPDEKDLAHMPPGHKDILRKEPPVQKSGLLHELLRENTIQVSRLLIHQRGLLKERDLRIHGESPSLESGSVLDKHVYSYKSGFPEKQYLHGMEFSEQIFSQRAGELQEKRELLKERAARERRLVPDKIMPEKTRAEDRHLSEKTDSQKAGIFPKGRAVWESADIRERRSIRETLDTRERRNIQKGGDARENKNIRESGDARESRNIRENRNDRDNRDIRENRNTRDSGGIRESANTRENRDTRQPGGSRGDKQPGGYRETQNLGLMSDFLGYRRTRQDLSEDNSTEDNLTEDYLDYNHLTDNYLKKKDSREVLRYKDLQNFQNIRQIGNMQRLQNLQTINFLNTGPLLKNVQIANLLSEAPLYQNIRNSIFDYSFPSAYGDIWNLENVNNFTMYRSEDNRRYAPPLTWQFHPQFFEKGMDTPTRQSYLKAERINLLQLGRTDEYENLYQKNPQDSEKRKEQGRLRVLLLQTGNIPDQNKSFYIQRQRMGRHQFMGQNPAKQSAGTAERKSLAFLKSQMQMNLGSLQEFPGEEGLSVFDRAAKAKRSCAAENLTAVRILPVTRNFLPIQSLLRTGKYPLTYSSPGSEKNTSVQSLNGSGEIPVVNSIQIRNALGGEHYTPVKRSLPEEKNILKADSLPELAHSQALESLAAVERFQAMESLPGEKSQSNQMSAFYLPVSRISLPGPGSNREEKLPSSLHQKMTQKILLQNDLLQKKIMRQRLTPARRKELTGVQQKQNRPSAGKHLAHMQREITAINPLPQISLTQPGPEQDVYIKPVSKMKIPAEKNMQAVSEPGTFQMMGRQKMNHQKPVPSPVTENGLPDKSSPIRKPELKLVYEPGQDESEKAQKESEKESNRIHQEVRRDLTFIRETRTAVEQISEEYRQWIQARRESERDKDTLSQKKLLQEEIEHTVHRQVEESINQIAARVYRRLEKKLQSEQDRRGLM